ncbi:MAG: cytochrome C oxidase subunit IV family protein [Planctomycetota bacterium]
MSEHIVPLKTYYAIFAALLVGTAVTVGVAFLDLGPMNTVVAITIAVIKALLVILYFMHVKYSSRLTWVFAGAGFAWLVLMIGLTIADFDTRGWI